MEKYEDEFKELTSKLSEALKEDSEIDLDKLLSDFIDKHTYIKEDVTYAWTVKDTASYIVDFLSARAPMGTADLMVKPEILQPLSKIVDDSLAPVIYDLVGNDSNDKWDVTYSDLNSLKEIVNMSHGELVAMKLTENKLDSFIKKHRFHDNKMKIIGLIDALIAYHS